MDPYMYHHISDMQMTKINDSIRYFTQTVIFLSKDTDGRVCMNYAQRKVHNVEEVSC
jgi:hypothetical protein